MIHHIVIWKLKDFAEGNSKLENAKLIKGEIEGNSICYCLDEKTFEVVKNYFFNIISQINQEKKCC